MLIFSGPATSIHGLFAGFEMNCGNLSGQALSSLSKGRSRDLFAGRSIYVRREESAFRLWGTNGEGEPARTCSTETHL